MKSLTEQLAEIKERCDKATEGPWRTGTCRDGIYSGKESLVKAGMSEVVGIRQLGYPQHNNLENIQFIAHARTDVPKLLAVIEKLIEYRNLTTMRAYSSSEDVVDKFKALDAELAKFLEGAE